MKIIKYEKLKNNRYKLLLDNDDTITLYDDVILKNDLLLTKNIEDINKLISENEYYDAYYDSIKYISRKLRATNEIVKYLNKKYDNSIIDNVINRLKEEKYLNDSLFASSYIHDAFILSNKGYYKIYNELENLGINSDIIKDNLDKINYNEWKDKLNKIIIKKVNTNKNYSNNKLKNKINNDMINLGYSKDMISDVLNSINKEDSNDILIKNYNKLYNKLSKKYEGKELKYQLLNRLLKEGFEYDVINKIIKGD